MVSWGEACVLGVVQGATEFLPVSSSGHLALVHRVLGPLPPPEIAAVDVALHVGTLVAVVSYFAGDLIAMLRACVRPTASWERRWVGLLALGSVPAGVLGWTTRSAIHASFVSLPIIGAGFLATGTLLWVAGRRAPAQGRGPAGVGAADALVIGLGQALALFPGVSRSGATIGAGMLRGVDAETAAKFSFLLGIPAIVGAELTELPTVFAMGSASAWAVASGALVAALTGFAAIGTLLRLVRADRLHYFALYLWPLGVLVLGAGLAEGW